ncbi:MAG: ATP-binding protein, partial [Anaerolineae bacterium]|nr:ATP-binding protein [Anaerolineae bacterium]
MTRNTKQSTLPGMEGFAPQFGDGFLQDHAGKIISDPKIALVELIANSWDAGADMVEIVWPENHGDLFSISDNGTGMTFDEFRHRWSHLKYNRKHEQGDDVEFPFDNMNSSRKAFGRNGKGRHAMFCFSDSYVVKTTKNGTKSVFEVRKAFDSSAPFLVYPVDQVDERGHGTSISANLYLNYLTIQDIRELIGSKFISDPAFRISVNGELVELTDVEALTKIYVLAIENIGEVLIRHIQSDIGGRTSKQNGVAWWVQKRLV